MTQSTYLLVVLILLLSLSVPCKSQQSDHQSSGLLFRRYPKQKLTLSINDAIQMTIKVSDDIACGRSCVHERWCRSVNFKLTTSKESDLHSCELISTDAYSHPKNLMKDENFIHWSIENPCAQNPCRNGGTCLSVRHARDDYICKCNRKNIGKQCQNLRDNLQLIGSANYYEGRVEVFHNGQWGTVCDDNWGFQNTRVVCRQLGYKGAKKALSLSAFGPGSGKIWMDNVGCNGTEFRLQNCSHEGWGNHNCDHTEDASVVCIP